jgi:hypothetical protein
MKVKDIVEGMAATYKIVKTGPEGTTLQSPDMHTMLTLDPEATKGIVADPNNPNHFVLSQAQASGTTTQPGQQQQGPAQGAEVEIPANETLDDDEIGGDPTDDYIDDVTDKEFEKDNKSESADLAHIRKLSGL